MIAAQRPDPGRIGRGQVQQRGALDTEQVTHLHLHAALGQHRVDLGLAMRPQPDQLRPVPDQLPQFPGRRWRDPRLRQPPHPQQIRQIGGIPLVVP
jgi:hypothetical protein